MSPESRFISGRRWLPYLVCGGGVSSVGPKAVALLAGIAVLLAACGGEDGRAEPRTGSPPGPSPAASQAADRLVERIRALAVPEDLVEGRSVGKKGAPAVLEVFEDFQCPFCLRWTAAYSELIVGDYVAKGKLRLEFRHLPILGRESVAAALASQCAAEQDQFWGFHDALFLIQAEAGQHLMEELNEGRYSQDALEGIARKLAPRGFDFRRWDQCMTSGASVAAVDADIRAARDAGLRGTPGFILNGSPLSSPPATEPAWRKLLDDAVKR